MQRVEYKTQSRAVTNFCINWIQTSRHATNSKGFIALLFLYKYAILLYIVLIYSLIWKTIYLFHIMCGRNHLGTVLVPERFSTQKCKKIIAKLIKKTDKCQVFVSSRDFHSHKASLLHDTDLSSCSFNVTCSFIGEDYLDFRRSDGQRCGLRLCKLLWSKQMIFNWLIQHICTTEKYTANLGFILNLI